MAVASRTVKGTRRRPFNFGKLLHFLLRDWLFSPWPLLFLAVLVGVQASLFAGSPTREHFFGVQYVITMLLAALASAALFGRAGRAETYAILARPVSRATLTLALTLAEWLVAIAGHLLGTAAVLVRFGPWLESQSPVTAWLDLQTILLGSVPLLPAALLSVCVVALLSTFITTTGARLVVLALIALLVMAFDSRNFPIEGARQFLQQIPPIIAPVVGALRYATTPNPDTQALYALIALSAYALALLLLMLALSAGRETVLD